MGMVETFVSHGHGRLASCTLLSKTDNGSNMGRRGTKLLTSELATVGQVRLTG